MSPADTENHLENSIIENVQIKILHLPPHGTTSAATWNGLRSRGFTTKRCENFLAIHLTDRTFFKPTIDYSHCPANAL